MKTPAHWRPTTYRGIEYPSMSAACRAACPAGWSFNGFRARAARLGIDEALKGPSGHHHAAGGMASAEASRKTNKWKLKGSRRGSERLPPSMTRENMHDYDQPTWVRDENS